MESALPAKVQVLPSQYKHIPRHLPTLQGYYVFTEDRRFDFCVGIVVFTGVVEHSNILDFSAGPDGFETCLDDRARRAVNFALKLNRKGLA